MGNQMAVDRGGGNTARDKLARIRRQSEGPRGSKRTAVVGLCRSTRMAESKATMEAGAGGGEGPEELEEIKQEIARLQAEENFQQFPGRIDIRKYPGIVPHGLAFLTNPTVQNLIDQLIYFIPVVGEARVISEAIIGRNLLTGEKLTLLDRLLSALPLAPLALKGGQRVIRGVSLAVTKTTEKAALILSIAKRAGKTPTETLALLSRLEEPAAHIGTIREVRAAVAEGRNLNAAQMNALTEIDEALQGGKASGLSPETFAEKKLSEPPSPAGAAAEQAVRHDTSAARAEVDIPGSAEKHEVVVSGDAIGRCSPPPCPNIALVYKEDLAKTGADGRKVFGDRFDKIRKSAAANPDKAARDAAALVKDMEAARDAARTERNAATLAELGEIEHINEYEGPQTRPRRPPLRRPGNAAAVAARAKFNNMQKWLAKKLGLPNGGQVHHAIELQVLDRFPGAFTEPELNSLGNMRGVPRNWKAECSYTNPKFVRCGTGTIGKLKPRSRRKA